MKKISTKLVIINIMIFMILSMISFSNVSKADSSSDLYLNKVEYNVKVNDDGSMNVEEKWNIDIENTNTLFKQFKNDSNKFTSITDGTVSVVNKNGEEEKLIDSNEYAYHVPVGEYYFLNRGDYYEVAWGTGLADDSGKREYVIRYKVNGAIAKYNDCSELYWQVFGSDCSIPINKLIGTVTLPSESNAIDSIKVWGHTPDLNGTIEVVDNHTVSFEVNDNKAEKMIEIRVAMPTDIIKSSTRTYDYNELDNILSEEENWAREANNTRIMKIVIVGAIAILFAAILIWIFLKNIHVIRTTKKMKPTEKFDYYRDLPDPTATPGEARFIIENEYSESKASDIGKIIMASILDLAVKKIIKIEKVQNAKGKPDFSIEFLKDLRDVPEDEREVYRLIKKTSIENKTSIKRIKDYIISTETVINGLKNELDTTIPKQLLDKNILSAEGIKRKSSLWYNVILTIMLFVLIFLFFSSPEIFTNMKNTIGISYSLMGVIFLMILGDRILGKIAEKRISAFTQQGIDDQEKWKAFKKYMEDFSLLKDREVPEVALWEKYLVYATAFGIADKVIKQLKIVYPEFESSDYLNTYVYMSVITDNNFYNSLNSISSATTSAFSSGSGSGGGFSGGGGFGGGGGGCGGR